MKMLRFLPLLFLLASCKSYMEYTAGINELNYTFDNQSVRRYADLNLALRHPDRVMFLDISLAASSDPTELNNKLNANIERFTNLKKFTLEGTDQQPVPENIFKMQKLEFLALTSFRDSSAMERLDELPGLRFLSLDFCGLTRVPESVLKLRRLQGLDLTGNEIAALPPEFSDLNQLITVDLTNNLFTEIPIVLKESPNLKYLDMNNAEGTDREQLRAYQVGVNDIRQVPDLNEFRQLKELYVTYAYQAPDSLQKEYANVKVR